MPDYLGIGGYDHDKINTKAVGVTKDGRQKILKRLVDEDSEIFVDRDPDNEFDPDAIEVYLVDGDKERSLGFINRDLAGKLAPMMDEGYSVTVVEHEVTGGTVDLSFGLNLTLDISDKPDERLARIGAESQTVNRVATGFAIVVVGGFLFGVWVVYRFVADIFGG